MVPVSTMTTWLFRIENAGGYFTVHPLPRSGLSDRLKSSRNTPLGSRTEKYWTLEIPPPEGLDTVTCMVPGTARSALASVAVSCVGDPYVVGRSVPFHCTTEPGTNRLPLTVSVKPRVPATADAGSSDVVVGTLSRLVRVKLSYV